MALVEASSGVYVGTVAQPQATKEDIQCYALIGLYIWEYIYTRSACMHGGRKHKHARRLVDKLSPIPFFQFSIVLHVYVSVYLHTLLWLFTAAIILVFHHDSSDLALDYDYNSST